MIQLNERGMVCNDRRYSICLFVGRGLDQGVDMEDHGGFCLYVRKEGGWGEGSLRGG